MLRVVRFVIVSACTLGFPLAGAGQIKQQFLGEAPTQWKERREFAKRASGVLRVRTTGSIDDSVYESTMEYQSTSTAAILVATSKETRKGKVEYDDVEAFCYNEKYLFILKKQNPSAQWVLTHYSEVRPNSDLGRVGRRLDDYLQCVSSSIRFENEYLEDIVQKPGFLINNIQPIQRDGKDLVEIGFTYTKNEAKNNRTASGRFYFDVPQGWLLVGGDVNTVGTIAKGKTTFRGNSFGVTTQKREDGFWESEGEFSSLSGESRNRKHTRYDVKLRESDKNMNATAFTLSAFGMPEPGGSAPQRTFPTYLWFIVGASGFTLFAVALRYFARRAQPNPPGA